MLLLSTLSLCLSDSVDPWTRYQEEMLQRVMELHAIARHVMQGAA
jgi:hypothetical protein